MAAQMTCELRGREQLRYLSYRLARSYRDELLAGKDRGRSEAELAAERGLLPEQVRLVLYATRAKRTATV